MPRQPRTKSKSKVYHCILRGINKQDIFFEKQDYFKFQEILKRSKKIFSYKLYSYVLMPNHIHLEIKDEFHKLSKVMQHIATSYAQYFNKKYKRTLLPRIMASKTPNPIGNRNLTFSLKFLTSFLNSS